jgi:hypothetical protein
MDYEQDYRIEITGTLNPYDIEILQLEIRRLANQWGAVVSAVRLEKGVEQR